MAETQAITFEDVVRAGRTLFGPAFAAEADGWRRALRTTYRRRAMETHPDRAGALGRTEVELAREFRAVSEAYRTLSALRAGPLPDRSSRRGAPAGKAAPARSAAARARRPAPAHDATPRARTAGAGSLPRRRLRIGEYLYYSGRVRWTDLVEAIAWQRSQRPAIGRIAVAFGFLSPDEVGVILEHRREAGAHGTPFGEWAVRLGYLTSFQLLAALGQQFRLQHPIGRFFVERGVLGDEELDEIRSALLGHNARHGQ